MKYTTPEVQLVEVETEDIILTSQKPNDDITTPWD